VSRIQRAALENHSGEITMLLSVDIVDGLHEFVQAQANLENGY